MALTFSRKNAVNPLRASQVNATESRTENWLARQFELSRGGEAANVRPMEGMRGFAVFLVFIVHYVSLAKPWIATGSNTMASELL